MKVDITPFEAWESLNLAVQGLLATPPDSNLRCYQGAATACFELALSTAQFYSHKRSVAILAGGTPHFQSILPYLYKEGYDVQMAPENLEAKAWVESLKKDTCFVLFSEDHAITGELYDTQELETLLNEKKIFCFKISHHAHLFRQTETLPYSARICAFDPQTAVAMIGNKLKAPPLISAYLSWEPEIFLHSIQKAKSSQFENRALVEKLEHGLPAGFQAFFAKDNRIWDRAVIYSEAVAGESLQQYVAGALGLKIDRPGFENGIETTHLCRWGGIKNYDEWWKPRPAESILRGLLLLGTQVLDHPGLRAALEKALRECQIASFDEN
jgi:hypothetical protein